MNEEYIDSTDRILTWFAYLWMSFAIFINVVAIFGFFLTTETFFEGWLLFTEIYSPFNIWNVIAELILASPAILAWLWRDRRRASIKK